MPQECIYYPKEPRMYGKSIPEMLMELQGEANFYRSILHAEPFTRERIIYLLMNEVYSQ